MDSLVAHWMRHYGQTGVCVLCGNSGVVDTTRTAVSPAGQRVGVRTYCICPNGRLMRRSKVEIPRPTTEEG